MHRYSVPSSAACETLRGAEAAPDAGDDGRGFTLRLMECKRLALEPLEWNTTEDGYWIGETAHTCDRSKDHRRAAGAAASVSTNARYRATCAFSSNRPSHRASVEFNHWYRGSSV